MIFQLAGDNAEKLNKNIETWTLTDESGTTSDRCSLVIDGDGLDFKPSTGDKYVIRIDGEKRGTFQVSAFSEKLHPAKFIIQLSPSRFQTNDKTEWRKARKKTFPAATIKDVVEAVMKPHGYIVKVDPDLAGVKTDHLNQNEETDKAFLSRIAKQYDAVAKPMNEMYVFGKKGSLKKLSGNGDKTPVSISPKDLIKPTGKIDYPTNIKYKGAKASWRNSDTGKNGEISIGSEPFKALATTFKTPEEATKNAESELQKALRNGQTFTGSIAGKKGLFAESVLTLDNFNNKRIAGKWSIDKVTLSGSRSKYTISVEASRPRS